MAAVKVGDKTYTCEDQKSGETFTKADVDTTLAACQSPKAK
jgi:hypothetical protein